MNQMVIIQKVWKKQMPARRRKLKKKLKKAKRKVLRNKVKEEYVNHVDIDELKSRIDKLRNSLAGKLESTNNDAEILVKKAKDAKNAAIDS